MLKSKGLSTDGSKANLIKRLYESGDKSMPIFRMSYNKCLPVVKVTANLSAI